MCGLQLDEFRVLLAAVLGKLLALGCILGRGSFSLRLREFQLLRESLDFELRKARL